MTSCQRLSRRDFSSVSTARCTAGCSPTSSTLTMMNRAAPVGTKGPAPASNRDAADEVPSRQNVERSRIVFTWRGHMSDISLIDPRARMSRSCPCAVEIPVHMNQPLLRPHREWATRREVWHIRRNASIRIWSSAKRRVHDGTLSSLRPSRPASSVVLMTFSVDTVHFRPTKFAHGAKILIVSSTEAVP